MKGARCLGFLALFAFARASSAMIVYESGDSLDNTYNTTAPGNGAPWNYVGQVTNTGTTPETGPGTDASAVYLGNGYVITAQHVDVGPSFNTVITLDGTSYAVNFSSATPVGPDLELYQIIGNPNLAPLTLTSAATGTNDLNMNATMIGFGEGKAGVIMQSGSDVGFTWGDDTTYAERWGTNVTLGTYFYDANNVAFLGTAFNINLGVNTASASLGDSGSALFENFSGTWELAGIWDAVDGTTPTSYYADSPNEADGMDNSYAIEIEPYSAQIQADIPEPASVALLGLGAAALAVYARRRRRFARAALRP